MWLSIFLTPIHLTGSQRLWMIIPLCAGIAVVYKTTRCERLKDVPLAAAVLTVTILLGMAAVGIGLYVLYALAA